MGGAGSSKTTHVAQGAGWSWEINYRQVACLGFPIPRLTHGGVHDTVGRFLVDFPLGMVGTDVAVIARFRLTSLFQAELMADVAFLATPNRSIHGRSPDTVAAFTGKGSQDGSFNGSNRITAFIRGK